VEEAVTFRNRQLEYFVTVADQGQITRAAAKLHIAQPALSQAISQLESEMGVKLLERHPRGVTLTPAGEMFYPKARAVVDRESEAASVANSLRRASSGAMELGFIGPPPTLSTPELLAALAVAHPEADISLRDMPFPSGSTTSWLQGVDAALCVAPAMEPGVRTQVVRIEPRAVVAGAGHPLCGREELSVAEVLEERYVAYHPDVQPDWAGFHSFDDHRGGPPQELTADSVLTSLQMLSAMTSGAGITTVPLRDAMIASQVLSGVSVIPVRDAAPAVISLVWLEENRNPLLEVVAATAERMLAVNGAIAPGAPPAGGADSPL
jgi:DNA-binding transcriptional LysR family regulator